MVSNEEKESCYAELVAVEIFNTLKKEKVSETIESFLKENNLKIHDIDVVVLGNNGDVDFDDYYQSTLHRNFQQNPTSFLQAFGGRI